MPGRTTRTKVSRLAAALGVVALAATLVAPAAAGANAKARRASVNSSEVQADNDSGPWRSTLSKAGRIVAFDSRAQNLAPNAKNPNPDIFVRDFKAGKTKLVSGTASSPWNGHESSTPAISPDGRFVAFASAAPDIVPGDTNGFVDIFVLDRWKKKAFLVSKASSGTQGNGYSGRPSVSADGRYVTFESAASNLVNNDSNGKLDIFVQDRRSGKTTLVSRHSNGTKGSEDSRYPVISGNGRFVAFQSQASELVTGDTNTTLDVFVHDRKKGKTTRVSVRSGGAQVGGGSAGDSPAISANGRYVAFHASSNGHVAKDTNALTDVFVHDRWTRKTTRVSVNKRGIGGNGHSRNSWLSANGRYVVFESAAANLVKGDSNSAIDIFVHDRRSKKTRRVSVKSNGRQVGRDSRFPAISGDGRFVSYSSEAPNLVKGDSNGKRDVFRYGPLR